MSASADQLSVSPLAAAGDLLAFAGLVLSAVVAGSLVASALDLEPGLVAALWSALLVSALLVAGCTLLLWRRGGGWRDLGLRRPGSLRKLAIETLSILGAVYVALIVSAAMTGQPTEGQPDLALFEDLERDPRLFLLALAVVWTAAAIGEEMIFRGFLLDRLARLFGGGAIAWQSAAILQGLVFGLSHFYQGAAGIWLTGMMGVIFGLAFLVTGRTLLPLILAHGLIDTVSLTRLFLGG